MKKKLYIKTALLSLVSMAMFSSCLKDDAHYINFAGSKPLVELPAATGVGAGGGFITPIALPISGTPAEVDLAVNLAAPKPLSTALTVKLAIDATALTNYNAAQAAAYAAAVTQYNSDLAAYNAGTSATKPTAPTAPTVYTLMPTNFYTTGSLTVTIPAGKNLVTIPINITTQNFDLSLNYVIPFTIVDGGGQQISNYKTVFYFIQGKNQYDGVYGLSGYIHRDDDLVLGGPFQSGITYALATTGANSVSFSQSWATGAGAGGVNPILVAVDPVTNLCTITSGVNATLTNLGTNNKYDPAKQTFYLSFIWNGADPAHRSTTDTLVYLHSR